MRFYETKIGDVLITAAPNNRFHPETCSPSSYTPGFDLQVACNERVRLSIETRETFSGNSIGSAACDEFTHKFLLSLGLALVPEPEPVKCPTCGAAK